MSTYDPFGHIKTAMISAASSELKNHGVARQIATMPSTIVIDRLTKTRRSIVVAPCQGNKNACTKSFKTLCAKKVSDY